MQWAQGKIIWNNKHCQVKSQLIILPLLLLVGLQLKAENIDHFNTKAKNGFIENKGQIHDQDYKPNPEVKYLLNLNNGLNVQLKANSFSYDTYVIERKAKEKAEAEEMDEPDMFRHPFDSIDNYEIVYHFHRIDIQLLNANPNPEIIARISL
jgi:hypothetical protein